MKPNLNFEELGIIPVVIVCLVLIVIFFTAYLITIKGMFDFFPNVAKALGAFLVDIAIGIVISIAMYGISSATGVNISVVYGANAEDLSMMLNPIIILAFAVSIIITILARKVTLNYATEMDTTILQSVNSIVMHYFYILMISLLISLVIAIFKI